MTRDDLIAALRKVNPAENPFAESEAVRGCLAFAFEQGWTGGSQYERGQKMCNAEAYLCAALILVPDGWTWSGAWFRNDPDTPGLARLINGRAEPPEITVRAATPAIALAIATMMAWS